MAFAAAGGGQQDDLAVDAAHMIAIAAPTAQRSIGMEHTRLAGSRAQPRSEKSAVAGGIVQQLGLGLPRPTNLRQSPRLLPACARLAATAKQLARTVGSPLVCGAGAALTGADGGGSGCPTTTPYRTPTTRFGRWLRGRRNRRVLLAARSSYPSRTPLSACLRPVVNRCLAASSRPERLERLKRLGESNGA